MYAHNADCDDDTASSRSSSFDHGSLAQKHLHFFGTAPNGTGGKMRTINLWRDGVRCAQVLASFLPLICHTSNMSEKHVLPGAQNVVIKGGTFTAADTVTEAP